MLVGQSLGRLVGRLVGWLVGWYLNVAFVHFVDAELEVLLCAVGGVEVVVVHRHVPCTTHRANRRAPRRQAVACHSQGDRVELAERLRNEKLDGAGKP